MFSDSDLTEIESSEDEAPLALKAAPRKGTKAKLPPVEYNVKNTLSAPRTASYTAKSLYDQIVDNTIDLDPEYQRDVVWNDAKMSGIIDSILRNFYVPPVIFNVSTAEDGSEMRTCIDGKQRLTSIMRFIDGQVPHRDSETGKKFWFKSSVKTRQVLPQVLRNKFSQKQIVCVEYSGLSEDQERELFQRVQLGMALTPAEKLAAIIGPWPTLIREFKDALFVQPDGFDGALKWTNTRGRDFQCLVVVLYYLANPTMGHPSPHQLETYLSQDTQPSVKFKAALDETFKVFVYLMKSHTKVFHEPAHLAPIEFVCVALMIHMCRKELGMAALALGIKKMRALLRKKFPKEVKMNGHVKKAAMKFVEDLDRENLQQEAGSTKSAVKELADITPAGKLGGKRKRKEAHSDDSGGSETSSPPPAKVKTKTKTARRSPVASTSKPIPTQTAIRSKPPQSTALPRQVPKPSPKPTPKPSSMATASSISNIPRIPKASQPPSDPPARKQSVPPPAQRAPTPRAPTPREPSAPPITVKSEPEPQSPIIPITNFSIAGRPPPPLLPPAQDPRRSLPHRPSWSSIPSPSSAIFPPTQRPMDALLVHNGISPSDPGPSNSNPPYSNLNGQYGSPHPPEPTFRQDPRNPLHGKLNENGMDNGNSNRPHPPMAPRSMTMAMANGHTSTSLQPQSFSSTAHAPFPPPPTSASSMTSSQSHYDYPPTSATSDSSKSSWRTSTYPYDRDRDRDRGRSMPRSPPVNHLPLRVEPMGHRRDSGSYAPRFSPPRDPRDRDPGSRYGAGRGRGGAASSQRDVPVNPLDRGWGGRGRGPGYTPR